MKCNIVTGSHFFFFCSSLQYRSALVVARMRNIVLLTYTWLMTKHIFIITTHKMILLPSLHANYALILLNTNYTNKLLSLERFERFVFKNQHSILFFKSHTDRTDFKLLPSSLCLDMNRRLQEVKHL